MDSDESLVFRALVGSVPQWHPGQSGPHSYPLRFGNEDHFFSSHKNLTPDLWKLKEYAEKNAGIWISRMPFLYARSSLRHIREELALFWLSLKAPDVAWRRFMDYAEMLRERTYENQSVSKNLVISLGQAGVDITVEEVQKIMDPLASGLNAFFRVDYQCRYIGYEQISMDEVAEPSDYKLYPDFLHPLASSLAPKEYAFSLTSRGDLVIIDRNGLLAALRKGDWYIYECNTLKNSMTAIMGGDYRLGCNLFDLVFDLSYRRHGALLVFDPLRTVVNKVVNRGSILADGWESDPARSMLKDSVHSINITAKEYQMRKKKMLLELASMDGAIIFDSANILAVGAMIETHACADGCAGARATAAKSASHHGGTPIKISSDGEISLYFSLEVPQGGRSYHRLDFM